MRRVASMAIQLLASMAALSFASRPPNEHDQSPTSILRATPDVINPKGFLDAGLSAVRLATVGHGGQPKWPEGTIAFGSTTHPPNGGIGDGWRTYDASNSIDGLTDTFWNDNNEYQRNGSSTLTITPPYPLVLSSISVVSSVDGVPQDFYVETYDETSHWVRVGSVSNNKHLECLVSWETRSVAALRIIFTRAVNAGRGAHVRVAEVYPGPFVGHPHWPMSTTAHIITTPYDPLEPEKYTARWPRSATAHGSTTHPPNNGNGDGPRTYWATNAIDGSPDTFWNSNNRNGQPDILTIRLVAPMRLDGLSIVSSVDGVIEDYTVETMNVEGAWIVHATIRGSSALARYISLPRNTNTMAVRVVVTKSRNGGRGIHTRIAAVVPGPYLGQGWAVNPTSRTYPPEGRDAGGMTYDLRNPNLGGLWKTSRTKSDLDTLTIKSPKLLVIPGITIVSDVQPVLDKCVLRYSSGNVEWKHLDMEKDVLYVYRPSDNVTVVKFRDSISLKELQVVFPPDAFYRDTPSKDIPFGILPRIDPVFATRQLSSSYVDIDLGSIVTGHFQLAVSAVSNPPPPLRLAFFDKPEDIPLHVEPEDPVWRAREEDDSVPSVVGKIICAEKARTFRFMRIYLGGHEQAGWIEFASIVVSPSPYKEPVGDAETDVFKASFLSSDPDLNQIWDTALKAEVSRSFAIGDDAVALSKLRSGWQWVVAERPADTNSVDSDVDSAPTPTIEETWAVRMAPLLITDILGIKATNSPDFSIFTVVPHMGDIKWVTGKMPTPHGDIEVSWSKNEEDETTKHTVTVPAGTVGRYGAPLSSGVFVNGTPVWPKEGSSKESDAESDGRHVHLTLQPGKYDILCVPWMF